MFSGHEPHQASSNTDAMRLTDLQDSKHDVKVQRANAVELPPASLKSEGMPIPLQAAKHPACEKDLGVSSPPTTNSSSGPFQSGGGRRGSADLEALERRSRKHSMTISEDCSSPVHERSNWPLLYQMIDVDPATDDSEFPEKARR